MHKMVLVAVTILLTACGSEGSSAAAEGPTVVATTSVLGDVVANVAGDLATVEVLMGPGADPHDFQPSAEQVARLRSAELVVANGLGLEAGMSDLFESARGDGASIIEVAESLDPIPFAVDPPEPGVEEEGHEGAEHGQGMLDPHFWLDPLRVADAARLIAGHLEEALPEHADAISRQTDAYVDDLLELHTEMEARFATIPLERRKLATNHEVLGYLADRYRFEIIGTVIPGGDTLAEPSAAALAELVATLETQGVTAIFAEASSPTAAAEAVAAELGAGAEVHVLFAESLGEPGSEVATYIEMMRANATIIAAALG